MHTRTDNRRAGGAKSLNRLLRDYRVLRDRAMRNARAAAESRALATSRESEIFWSGVRDAYVLIARLNSAKLVRLLRALGVRRAG